MLLVEEGFNFKTRCVKIYVLITIAFLRQKLSKKSKK